MTIMLANHKPLRLILPGSYSSSRKYRDCARQYWQEVILHQRPADDDREVVFGYGLCAHDAIEQAWQGWAEQYAPADAEGRRRVDATPYFGLLTGLLRHAPLVSPAPPEAPAPAEPDAAAENGKPPTKRFEPSANQLARWNRERELLAQWIERESAALAWSMGGAELLIEVRADLPIEEYDLFDKVPADAYVPPLKTKLDLGWVKDGQAWLVDWKTSQTMPLPYDFQTGKVATQLALYAWILMKMRPDVQQVNIAYYSTREGVHSDWLALDMPTAKSHGLDWLLEIRKEIAELNPFDPATWPTTPHKFCNSCPVYSECFDRKAAYALRKLDEETSGKPSTNSRRKGRR